MIFLTLGTHQPFDRLVAAVDAWCGEDPRREVFGQIAEPGPGGYRPRHFRWTQFLDPAAYRVRLARSSFIVAHAGMGSIITALGLGKPILVMPRRAILGEQRNDHQLATVARFRGRPGIHVAMEAGDIGPSLTALSSACSADGMPAIGRFAEDRLIRAVRRTILAP